jgi:hypothetical protein
MAKTVELWLGDAFGGIEFSARDRWGGKVEIELGGLIVNVLVEDANRADGKEWAEITTEQREHLEAWEKAGRPSLEEIQELKGIGRITRVEAAAVRTMRAGEAIEGMNFTPEEIARMKRDIFLDVLARRVDDMLGECQDPPASVVELAKDVRLMMRIAYDVEAVGEGGVVDAVIEGRRFVGTFEAVAAPKPEPKPERKPRTKRSKAKAG